MEETQIEVLLKQDYEREYLIERECFIEDKTDINIYTDECRDGEGFKGELSSTRGEYSEYKYPWD